MLSSSSVTTVHCYHQLQLLLLFLLFMTSTTITTSTIKFQKYQSPITNAIVNLKSKYYGFIKESYYVDANNNKYTVNDEYIDFIDKNNDKFPTTINKLISENLFQTSPISYIYKRGYRQNFQQIGFPGIEKEFDEVNNFFLSTNNTDVIVDLSCGTGFMTRKFIKSNNYDCIIGGDLSRSMLAEARNRINEDGLDTNRVELIRLNVNNLPFQSNSVNGIHAGAALHCYTDLEKSLSEIYRILKNNGVFYASTFFKDAFNINSNNNGFYLFKDEKELIQLLHNAGFALNCIQVRREGRACAIIKAIKGDRTDLFKL